MRGLIANATGLHLTAYAALPTYRAALAVTQYLFVNWPPVRDKLLVGALRGALFYLLSRDRHPAARCFVDCDPSSSNVERSTPAKSEVRFATPVWRVG